MKYTDLLIPEFDQEMNTTRRVLERVPDAKLSWRAHPKSNTIGWNANHLAEIPGWVAGTLMATEWDLAPACGEPYRTPALESTAAIVGAFDHNVAEARRALEQTDNDALHVNWSLLMGGQPLFTMPRINVIRTWVLNHTIHHRAHLCVYLRLNEVAVPSIYGPSGDESPGESKS